MACSATSTRGSHQCCDPSFWASLSALPIEHCLVRLADLEALGFVTRIRRIRRVATALGFKVEQITNAYRVHEPTRGLGLLALAVFTSEYNYSTPSEAIFSSKRASDEKRRADRLCSIARQ
jgi:hypothetical protein